MLKRFKFQDELCYPYTDSICFIGAAIAGSAATSLIGGVMSSGAASSAADQQAAAANNAAQVQQNMFNTTQGNLQPFIKGGQGANSALLSASGLTPDASGNITGNPLTSPLLQAPSQNLSEAALQQTPGYQFDLTQGLKATQNSAAARGLGTSGAAVKGAASYATGLADNTYQNQFSNAVTNQTNQFNRLMSLTNLGENAGANLGNLGTQTAANIGSTIVGGANASAASTIAGANALTSGFTGAGNAGLIGQFLSQPGND